MKNSAQVQIPKLLAKFLYDPRRALVAAGILHVVVAVLIFGVGRLGIYSQQFNQNGIGYFALDSYSYQTDIDLLAGTLTHSGPRAWLTAPSEIHSKLYSLSFALLRPVLGKTILAVEPLNLLYYLAILILTFSLTKRLADQRAALLAAALVAVWPSFLLHTTQFLRDPLFIVAILTLVLMLTDLLTITYSLRKGLGVAAIGALAALTLWLVRSEMWLVVRVIVFVGLALFAIRILRERRLLAGNLAGIVLLFATTIATTVALPPAQTISPVPGPPVAPVAPQKGEDVSLWAQIAKRRHGFIATGVGQSGSTVDPDVEFSGRADIIKYVPRAVEIGYLAPFPKMWFTRGYNVQLIGRLVAAAEMVVLYIVEILAVIALWQKRRQLTVWLLILSGAACVTALGLVVVNVGTLYRMRYAFFILLIILAATVVGRFLKLPRPAADEIGESTGSSRKAAAAKVAIAGATFS
jgi:hypothetical protein